MKKVTVIGIGLGESTITPQAREAIMRAEVAFGAQRVLDVCKGYAHRSYPRYLPADVAAAVADEDAREFAVLVSGDVGFYSAAAGLNEALSAHDIRFVPGISTAGAFFARLKLPWQDAAFISAHGRDINVVDTVRRNRLTFCLTGNNVGELGTDLIGSGFGFVKTYVGENLGTEEERIVEMAAENLTRSNFPSLTVLLFQNEEFDDTTPIGLPDSRFLRLESIPMTKSETRALAMSKLNLKPASVCYDIGAGTGSVAIEMALAAYRGHVYAVEQKEAAISLINRNCESFHLGNVTALCGEAPTALETLPVPDAVFIGGSGGELENIVKAVWEKNPNARIVVTAVTMETAALALSAFKDAGLDPEITQISTAHGRRVGRFHMMEAQNPITILSAGGKT
jgi:precorrin-6Y C5,15-methyltransferase (decarboxylating)